MSQLDQPYAGDEHPIWAAERLRKKEFEEIISRFPELTKVEAILHALPGDYIKQNRLLSLVHEDELIQYLRVNIQIISDIFDKKMVNGTVWRNATQFINCARRIELESVVIYISRNTYDSSIPEEPATEEPATEEASSA